MSRGVVTDHVTVRLPVGGQLLVPVAVAWARCACGEYLAWVGDAEDNARAGLVRVEAEDQWDGDVCGECVAKILVGQIP